MVSHFVHTEKSEGFKRLLPAGGGTAHKSRGRPWYVCEVVLVPCAVCEVRECGRRVVAGCDYMCGTRDSDVVSSADDVLEMSVGAMCERCLARGGVRGVRMSW